MRSGGCLPGRKNLGPETALDAVAPFIAEAALLSCHGRGTVEFSEVEGPYASLAFTDSGLVLMRRWWKFAKTTRQAT